MCGKWSCYQLLLLLQLQLLLICFATNSMEYYTAGVIEFRPAIGGASSAQLLQENLAAYLQLIKLANGTADILVFPEGTLNSQLQLTTIPAPSAHTLCLQAEQMPVDDEVADFLRQLACAAVTANSYLLLNVKEREECELDADADEDATTSIDCPARGYRLYNTNVVLDRSGAVVSRYRKWNLYLEPQLNRTAEPEFAIFETDFNVTFGHFICFDMLLYTPAQELVERYDIQNVIVSNMFNSELPFLTASQLQQGWAWANNVNLLAAGASLPHGGISGSGIYAAQNGALVRCMVGDAAVGERQLLLTKVPRWPKKPLSSSVVQLDVERVGPAQRQLKMLQQPQLNEFNSWQLPLMNATLLQQRLCQADLCCNFEVRMQLGAAGADVQQYEYSYRLGVFVGQRRYEEAQYSVIRLCGLFACRNGSVSSCGMLSEGQGQGQDAALEFCMLRVTGEFVRRRRRLLMPSTLSASLYALQSSELDWHMQQPETIEEEEAEGVTRVELLLKKPHSKLLTFGIYGNYFDEYEQDQGGSGDGGTRVARASAVIICGLLLLLFFSVAK